MNWSRQPTRVVAPPLEADVQSMAWSTAYATITPEGRQAFVDRTYYVIRTGPRTWGVVERSNYLLPQSDWSRPWSSERHDECDLLITGPSMALEIARSLAESVMAPDEWDGRPKG